MSKVDTRTHEELREAVRSGDMSIMPGQLSDARERDELLRLQAEAQERAEQERAEVEHRATAEALYADIAALADNSDTAEAAHAAVTALVSLVGHLGDREAAVMELLVLAKRQGLSRAWRVTPSGHPELITRDGRRIRVGDTGNLLDAVLAEAKAVAGLRGGRHQLDEVLDALDTGVPVPKPDPVTIQWVPSRTGKNHVEQVTASEADRLVARGRAVRV